MSSLLPAVASRLFVRTRLASSDPLDGAYASLQRGRSDDFEDLREYEYGDDVRDIDWNATARHGEIFVRRSRARRMHTLLVAVDTGRGMAALSPDERPKRDLAVLATGVLALLALRHGDAISVVYGDANGTRRIPGRRSEGAIEHALRTVRDATTEAAASSRTQLLGDIARTVSRRAILVIVTGEDPITTDEERLVRRLRAQHDVLWLAIRDADPIGPGARADADSGWRVPAFLRGNERVAGELADERDRADAERAQTLDALGISHAVLEHAETATAAILGMLAGRPRVGS